MAAALPGDSFTGEVVVGGLLNFLSIYNILITGRVLLSWVPQVRVGCCVLGVADFFVRVFCIFVYVCCTCVSGCACGLCVQLFVLCTCS